MNISTMIENLKSLNNLLLARAEITCHIIVTCQKQSPNSVAEHNIFESAPTSHDEDLVTISVGSNSKAYNIAECKQTPGTKSIIE